MKKLREIEFGCWDVDGVTYDFDAYEGFHDICNDACAAVGHLVLPELDLEESRDLGIRSYKEHGNCVGAFVEWAAQNGRDPIALRDRVFENYHRELLTRVFEAHPHFCAPDPETVAVFSRCADFMSHGTATHASVEHWAKPVARTLRLIPYFNEAAMIGLKEANFDLKSDVDTAVRMSIKAASADPHRTLFAEDSLKNLARQKELIAGLTTLFIHHGRPLEGRLPAYVDFQFATPRDAMLALETARITERRLIVAPR